MANEVKDPRIVARDEVRNIREIVSRFEDCADHSLIISVDSPVIVMDIFSSENIHHHRMFPLAVVNGCHIYGDKIDHQDTTIWACHRSPPAGKKPMLTIEMDDEKTKASVAFDFEETEGLLTW